MAPELRHLRAFLVLADELNFTAAGRRLFVSQQALSRLVQQLEREVGVPLVRRSTRSVALTDAGTALLAGARRAVSAADQAVVAARRAHAGPRAVLRVDVSSSGLETGALLLDRLRDAHSEVAVHETEVGVERGLAMLAAGELDVLMGVVDDPPPELARAVVRHERVLIGMARDHRLAAEPAVRVAALAGERLLLPADGTAPDWVRFVLATCRAAGVEPRRYNGVTHGSAAAAAVVGQGRCVVPTTAWAAPPAELVFRPLVEPAPVVRWAALTRPQDAGRPEVAAFLDTARVIGAEREWTPPSR
jgi:DNA-binding transcriptional LysR family regulator